MFLLLRVWLHGVVKGSKLRLALGRPRRLYTMGFYTRGCDPADKIHTLTSLDDVGNCMGSYYKLEILFQLFKKTDKTFDMKYAWLSEGCMITVTMPNHAMFCLSLVTFLLLYYFSPSYYIIMSSHVMTFKLWNIFQIIKTSQQPFYFLQTNHSSISSHDNWVNDWIYIMKCSVVCYKNSVLVCGEGDDEFLNFLHPSCHGCHIICLSTPPTQII